MFSLFDSVRTNKQILDMSETEQVKQEPKGEEVQDEKPVETSEKVSEEQPEEKNESEQALEQPDTNTIKNRSCSLSDTPELPKPVEILPLKTSTQRASSAIESVQQDLEELATGISSWGSSFVTNFVTKTKTAAEQVMGRV